MRRVFLCCVLFWSTASFARDETRVLTESEAVAALMASDPNVRALRARVDEVRAREAERVRWPNPGFVYSRESVSQSDDLFLVGRQELPITGRRGRLQEAGRLAVEAMEADVRFLVAELQSDLRRAFTALLLAQEHEAVLRRDIEDLQRLIEVLRLREEAGEGSRYDRMRGERALVDLEADLAASEAARAQAQGRLAASLGENILPHSIVAEGPLDVAAPPPPAEELVERALRNRADYQATGLALAQLRAEREAAHRMRIPTPTVSGGLKRSTIGDLASDGYVFSLDLSLPLFNHGQSAEAFTSAQATRAEAEAAALSVRIEAEVRAAHAVADLYRQRAERYRVAVSGTAEPLVTIGRVGYEDGEMGILELLDAIRQALDARLRVLDLAAAARAAAIDLDRVTGTEYQP
jgi:multidrug efflux system outer membrane protein